jgi:hypothetical protein
MMTNLFSQKFEKFDEFKIQIEYAKGSVADPDPHGSASKSKARFFPHLSQISGAVKSKCQSEKSDSDPHPSKKGIRIRITLMRICNTG